jgi:hypothetical protein
MIGITRCGGSPCRPRRLEAVGVVTKAVQERQSGFRAVRLRGHGCERGHAAKGRCQGVKARVELAQSAPVGGAALAPRELHEEISAHAGARTYFNFASDLLSDGEDTSSLVTFEDVLDLAKRSETVIYAIGLRSVDWRNSRTVRDAEFVLRRLAQETGGRADFVSRGAELGGIYDRIAEELASQYTIGYTPVASRQDGQWRGVQVLVSHPNTVARTKQGYYASGSAQ